MGKACGLDMMGEVACTIPDFNFQIQITETMLGLGHGTEKLRSSKSPYAPFKESRFDCISSSSNNWMQMITPGMEWHHIDQLWKALMIDLDDWSEWDKQGLKLEKKMGDVMRNGRGI